MPKRQNIKNKSTLSKLDFMFVQPVKKVKKENEKPMKNGAISSFAAKDRNIHSSKKAQQNQMKDVRGKSRKKEEFVKMPNFHRYSALRNFNDRNYKVQYMDCLLQAISSDCPDYFKLLTL